LQAGRYAIQRGAIRAGAVAVSAQKMIDMIARPYDSAYRHIHIYRRSPVKKGYQIFIVWNGMARLLNAHKCGLFILSIHPIHFILSENPPLNRFFDEMGG